MYISNILYLYLNISFYNVLDLHIIAKSTETIKMWDQTDLWIDSNRFIHNYKIA